MKPSCVGYTLTVLTRPKVEINGRDDVRVSHTLVVSRSFSQSDRLVCDDGVYLAVCLCMCVRATDASPSETGGPKCRMSLID